MECQISRKRANRYTFRQTGKAFYSFVYYRVLISRIGYNFWLSIKEFCTWVSELPEIFKPLRWLWTQFTYPGFEPYYLSLGIQGWHIGESARLPPLWPECDSRTRRHMWVEFVVGSRPCSEGFSPGSPVFLPPQKPTLQTRIRSGNEGPRFVSFADWIRLIYYLLLFVLIIRWWYKKNHGAVLKYKPLKLGSLLLLW